MLDDSELLDCPELTRQVFDGIPDSDLDGSREIRTRGFPLSDRLHDQLDPITRALHDRWVTIPELQRFAESTMRLAPGRLLNGFDGADVVSDVLLSLHERLTSEHPPDVSTREKLRGYLFRSVKYRAIDVGRSQRAKDMRVRTVSAPWERGEDSALFWEPPAVDHTVDRVPAELVAWLRSVLTPRELDVLDLAYQGYRNPEIAEKLSITASSVRTIRERIRKRIRLAGVVDSSGLDSVVRDEREVDTSVPFSRFCAAA